MRKVKFRIPSWNEGREFMKNITSQFNVDLIEKDADLSIENETFKITCHFDDRGFSFIIVKILDLSLESELAKFYSKYVN